MNAPSRAPGATTPPAEGVLRVAIIGQGPKGLYALAELVHRWPAGRGLEVHTYDEHAPGTGAAYDPSQPEWLRLNVTPRIVQLDPLPGLVDWLRARGTDPDGDVPRALVGRYLAEAHSRLLDELPARVRVVQHRARLHTMRPSGGGWLLDDEVRVDEVLLATGHAGDHDAALARRWNPDQPTRLVPAVYPVADWLDEGHVPAGCTVAVRGAALTFIDVALTLTEGRAPARRPARILPLSRAGQLLHTKPSRGSRLTAAQEEILLAAADAVPDSPTGAVEHVVATAAALLAAQGVAAPQALRQVEETLAQGTEPDLVTGPHRALAALERSLAVDDGTRLPGAAWLLGRTWAALYPTLVERLSFHHGEPEQWQVFARAAATLERFTYGPLRPNAERLLALCREGIVDLSWMAAGVGVDDTLHHLPAGEQLPDVVVDAVNSPAGALTARQPLVDSLVQAGHLHLAPPRRGVLIDCDARCLDAGGTPVAGLSALGRVVEDVVIGNDTLGRSLHDQIERWAARLAKPLPPATDPQEKP